MSLFVLPGLCLSTHKPPLSVCGAGGREELGTLGMGFLGCLGECVGGGWRGRVMLGGSCCWTAEVCVRGVRGGFDE